VSVSPRHKAQIDALHEDLTGSGAKNPVGQDPAVVVDDDTVVLPLDHPFVAEGRFASLLVRDAELAGSLIEGFEKLWRKAMRSLQEINFDPRRH